MIKIIYNWVVRGLWKWNVFDLIVCMGLLDSVLNVKDKKIDVIFIVIIVIFIVIIYIDCCYCCIVVINVIIFINESNDNVFDEWFNEDRIKKIFYIV